MTTWLALCQIPTELDGERLDRRYADAYPARESLRQEVDWQECLHATASRRLDTTAIASQEKQIACGFTDSKPVNT